MKNHNEKFRILFVLATLNLSAVPTAIPAASNVTQPSMVDIPSEHYEQGRQDVTVETSTAAPAHPVKIQAFAVSRSEITVAEFRAFVEASGYRTDAERDVIAFGDAPTPGCFLRRPESTPPVAWIAENSWQHPGFPQGEDHPVVCVSWNDAQAYITWLGEISGEPFRLLSESEHEYLIRQALNTTSNDCTGANLGDADLLAAFHHWPENALSCSDGHAYTAPVGSYPADGFGLFDMVGNVAEWSADCWHANYINAPEGGRAWEDENDGDCAYHVLRGSDFVAVPGEHDASKRSYIPRAFRSYHVGFRVARDVTSKATKS